MPDVIQRALDSSPSRRSTSNRDSMQRKRSWWLPYVVLEFDKNEILIDAMGGSLVQPEWNYKTELCVYTLTVRLRTVYSDNIQRCVAHVERVCLHLSTSQTAHGPRRHGQRYPDCPR